VELHNAMTPTREQIADLIQSGGAGPIVMVNLLRFREKAQYADGRETNLTGLEAFMVYSGLMKPIVEGFGGRFLISTLLERLVIGSGEMGWHRLALVEYPSRTVFAQVAQAPEVREAAVHRHAGLEGQLLIASTLQTDHRG
jgi:uncharacterized protein (DUF1330 family)